MTLIVRDVEERPSINIVSHSVWQLKDWYERIFFKLLNNLLFGEMCNVENTVSVILEELLGLRLDFTLFTN